MPPTRRQQRHSTEIGMEYHRWSFVRHLMGFETNEHIAGLLLDGFHALLQQIVVISGGEKYQSSHSSSEGHEEDLYYASDLEDNEEIQEYMDAVSFYCNCLWKYCGEANNRLYKLDQVSRPMQDFIIRLMGYLKTAKNKHFGYNYSSRKKKGRLPDLKSSTDVREDVRPAPPFMLPLFGPGNLSSASPFIPPGAASGHNSLGKVQLLQTCVIGAHRTTVVPGDTFETSRQMMSMQQDTSIEHQYRLRHNNTHGLSPFSRDTEVMTREQFERESKGYLSERLDAYSSRATARMDDNQTKYNQFKLNPMNDPDTVVVYPEQIVKDKTENYLLNTCNQSLPGKHNDSQQSFGLKRPSPLQQKDKEHYVRGTRCMDVNQQNITYRDPQRYNQTEQPKQILSERSGMRLQNCEHSRVNTTSSMASTKPGVQGTSLMSLLTKPVPQQPFCDTSKSVCSVQSESSLHASHNDARILDKHPMGKLDKIVHNLASSNIQGASHYPVDNHNVKTRSKETNTEYMYDNDGSTIQSSKVAVETDSKPQYTMTNYLQIPQMPPPRPIAVSVPTPSHNQSSLAHGMVAFADSRPSLASSTPMMLYPSTVGTKDTSLATLSSLVNNFVYNPRATVLRPLPVFPPSSAPSSTSSVSFPLPSVQAVPWRTVDNLAPFSHAGSNTLTKPALIPIYIDQPTANNCVGPRYNEKPHKVQTNSPFEHQRHTIDTHQTAFPKSDEMSLRHPPGFFGFSESLRPMQQLKITDNVDATHHLKITDVRSCFTDTVHENKSQCQANETFPECRGISGTKLDMQLLGLDKPNTGQSSPNQASSTKRGSRPISFSPANRCVEDSVSRMKLSEERRTKVSSGDVSSHNMMDTSSSDSAWRNVEENFNHPDDDATKVTNNGSNNIKEEAKHTRSRRLKCNICQKKYHSGTDLLVHRYEQHSYVCGECDSRFLSLDRLKAHKTDKHPGVKVCSQCPYRSASEQDMYQHAQNQHRNSREASESGSKDTPTPTQPPAFERPPAGVLNTVGSNDDNSHEKRKITNSASPIVIKSGPSEKNTSPPSLTPAKSLPQPCPGAVFPSFKRQSPVQRMPDYTSVASMYYQVAEHCGLNSTDFLAKNTSQCLEDLDEVPLVIDTVPNDDADSFFRKEPESLWSNVGLGEDTEGGVSDNSKAMYSSQDQPLCLVTKQRQIEPEHQGRSPAMKHASSLSERERGQERKSSYPSTIMSQQDTNLMNEDTHDLGNAGANLSQHCVEYADMKKKNRRKRTRSRSSDKQINFHDKAEVCSDGANEVVLRQSTPNEQCRDRHNTKTTTNTPGNTFENTQTYKENLIPLQERHQKSSLPPKKRNLRKLPQEMMGRELFNKSVHASDVFCKEESIHETKDNRVCEEGAGPEGRATRQRDTPSKMSTRTARSTTVRNEDQSFIDDQTKPPESLPRESSSGREDGRQSCSQCTVEGCRASFGKTVSLEHHMLTAHSGAMLFRCQECDHQTKSRRAHYDHVRSKHRRNGRRHLCTWPDCHKGFFTASHLRVHTLSHTGEKPVACKLCDYRCRQKSALSWHLMKKHGISGGSDIPTSQN